MVTINIEKRHLYLISAIFVFLVGVGLVMSYNSGGPASVVGHDFDELEGVQKIISGSCSGQVMVGVDANGVVICEADDAGTIGSLSCEIVLGPFCPEGKTKVSGGGSCRSNEVTASYPWLILCNVGSAQDYESLCCEIV